MSLLAHVPAPTRTPVVPTTLPPLALVEPPADRSLVVRSTLVDRRAPRLHVETIDLPVGAREARPLSQSEIDTAAATADVVRLRHTAAVPSDGALARVIALLEDALATAGRPRSAIRIALELQVAVVRDAAGIARKRTELAHLDALSGLSWSPSATWVVTTAERLVDDVLAAAAPLEVDDVVLQPLGPAAAAVVR